MKHTSKRISALFALLLALAATGCGTQPDHPQPTAAAPAATEPEPEPAVYELKAVNLTEETESLSVNSTEPDAEFLSAQTDFALTLMNQTAAERGGENILISPYSVMQALAMTANGAGGNTRAEMEQTLGGIPADALNQYLYAQRTALNDTAADVLKTANSIWFRHDADRIQVKPEFLQRVAGYYGADAFAAPFDRQTTDDINNWCRKQTNGMIPVLLSEPIPEEAVMYLINAVCFDAKWAHAYEAEPKPLDFTAADGTVQQAQMMYSEESCYLEDAHATGFMRYYKGGQFAFAALLPEEGMTPESYLAQLSPENLRDVLVNAEDGNVHAGLPQFSYDFDIELRSTLTEMGMGSAFDESADFSNMAKTASGALFINRVLHKTHIDVDTEGTKAAAATAVEMNDECDAEEPDEQKYVILDRPFVYMIVDTQTMLPVFFGILNSAE